MDPGQEPLGPDTPPPEAQERGLRWAFALDGEGGAVRLGWEEVRRGPREGPAWVHVDRTHAEVQAWIREEAGLEPWVAEALLAEETRPRSLHVGGGLLVILRGVNLNPGAEPDDMISIRLWIEERRLISLRAHRLRATRDVAEELLDARRGPASVPQLLVRLAQRLTDRIGEALEDLDAQIDVCEEALAAGEPVDRTSLMGLRRQAILLRRWLAPQRAAVAYLRDETVSWLDHERRSALREVADRTLRYVEDCDAIRERAVVVKDELSNRLAEQLGQRMYVLALLAAIFLPLTLFTGLLGINVAGIPFAEAPWAFGAVCGILAATAVLLGAGLRRSGWL